MKLIYVDRRCMNIMRKMSLSEQITYSTVKIACAYADHTTGSGSGFIMNICENKELDEAIPVIITNNHVINNSIASTFDFCAKDSNGNPIDTQVYSVRVDGNAWTPHPDKNIDLCIMPIAEIVRHFKRVGFNPFYIALSSDIIADDGFYQDLCAMEDVTMVGYPIGLMDQYNHKPIIRRGITATHPRNDYQGKSEILLDIAAFPGSSGSPVFILNEGSFMSKQGGTLNIGSRIKLIGILSSGPQFTAVGSVTFATLPVMPKSITNIPINLGIAIKAQNIVAFEKSIKKH